MKTIKKLYNISPYIFIVMIACTTLLRELGINGDELWNYNFAKNICDGLIPYRDINMVPTPFSAYLAAAVMFIFGEGIIVYRVLGIILMAVTFSIFYKLLKKSTESMELSFAVTIFCMLLIQSTWIFNYNMLNLCILLGVFYIGLYMKYSLRNEIIIAVLIGLTPMIKQTTGLFILLAYLVISFMNRNKSKLNLIIKTAITLVPSVIYFIYLIYTGVLGDFIDYTVVGVKYFTHKSTYWYFICSSPANFAIGIGFIVILCLIAKNLITSKDKDQRLKIIYMLLITVFAGVVAYPLTDRNHLMVAIIPYIVCWFLTMKKVNISPKEGGIIYAFIGALVIVSLPIIASVNENQKWTSLNNFEYSLIDENVEGNIIKVSEFIKQNKEKGIDVYITNEAACIYMIPLDLYNKNFDLLFLGNLGSNTIEDLLDVDDDSLFLVNKVPEDLNDQCHFELIDYIIENYECVGEIINYDIYRKNIKE